MSNLDRRGFVTKCALGVGGVGLGGVAVAPKLATASATENNPIVVFAKHIQGLSFDELGRRLMSINVQGIEATLRDGGQIAPAELSSKLGTLCDALSKHNQKVIIAASDINEVNAESEQYLAQLVKHGIPYFRMAYYRYDFRKPVLPQLREFAKRAHVLAELCGSLGVTALYQNHAGKNYVGAALWDLQQVLAEIPRKQISVALDIRHASLELSQSYQAGYSAIRSHIGATYVKDFDWRNGQAENVPLGKGRSKPLFDLIRKDGLIGPLSLHMEYTDHRDATVLEESWQAVANDVAKLRSWLT